MHLRGATAFVTGAAQGLGKAFSESLLARGASVCLSDIQVSKGKQLENELQQKYGKDKVIFLECDVRSETNLSSIFQEAISRFGHIDLMVNNAGIADESLLRKMIDINVIGVISGTGLAINHMRKDHGGKGGTIINISSTAGLTPAYFTPNYAASKFAVTGFTSSWASNPHQKEIGIQFACLCPAFTDTPIIQIDREKSLYYEEALAIVNKMGINEVSTVVGGFLQLVESGNCNGDVVTITTDRGVQYVRKNGKFVQPRL